MIQFSKHPVLVFGIGMIGGAWIYKNRQAIIDLANKSVESGKDIMLERKEKVPDLTAQCIETEASS